MASFDDRAIEHPVDGVTGEDLPLTKRQTAVMLMSVMVVALCGIVYELIIAAVSSYLLGNSVYQFSLTIGFFMFAMGLGSYFSRWFEHNLLSSFIQIEIAVALIGGICSSLLFVMFPYHSLYKPVMFTLIIVIGTLVGLEIPLLARILSRSTQWKESIANVLSLDYLGALVGSVAFPIFMLPTLGLFRSSFAIGLLNIGVAIVAILVFGNQLSTWRRSLIASIVVLAVLIGGLLGSESLSRFAESQMYADTIVYRQQTPYQRIIVTENQVTHDVRLYLDKHIQFASIDEHRYHESLVHPILSLPGGRQRVLILGGGDGMAVREVLKFPDVQSITMIDIDPAITRLCSTFNPIVKLNKNALSDARLTIINDDAFRWLLDYAGNIEAKSLPRFDRVIIDLPDPHNEVLDKLYSREFFQILRQCMTADGYLVTQSSSPFFAREVFWCIHHTIADAGLGVQAYQIPMVSFGIWGFNLASANGQPVPPIAFDESRSRFISDDVYQSATIFGRDIGEVATPVNRTFEPKLYSLYVKGLKR